MLIPFSQLKSRHGLGIRGILHVGAHLGEEAGAYQALGVTEVTWIEGNPELIPKLKTHVEPMGHRVVCALVSDDEGTPVKFNVANNGMSSSMLELGTHRVVHPGVFYTHALTLPTTTIDALHGTHDFSRLNLLNMDLQGAELLCLRGAVEYLKYVDIIYTEVNTSELYVGGALLPDLQLFLSDFELLERKMQPWRDGEDTGWGDALFRRRIT
jgi:FkbM family methyltransferase